MAYISFQPSDYFNTLLYSGNSSTQALTGLGFEPDLVWIKNRDGGAGSHDHYWFDQVRGTTKHIRSNGTNAEGTASGVTSFDSDGFTLGSSDGMNETSRTFASWNWRAGTTSGIATNGYTDITPSGYSFNQTAGFSIVKWTGTGVDGAYLPHGLGKTPQLLFLKSTNLAESWQVYSEPTGNQGRGWLNLTNAFQTSRGEWYSNDPDSVNMRISNDSHINGSGNEYVGYFFTSIKGYSKIGSYTGNGNADGTFVYTGFKPAFVLFKETTVARDWIMYDNKRIGYNPTQTQIKANTNEVEATDTTAPIDLCSNGFKLRGTKTWINESGQTYIYMAFAEHPLVSSNDIPSTAR